MSQDVSCLMSTVKNISGVRKYFGFLPGGGQELDVDQELDLIGTPTEAIARAAGRSAERNVQELVAAVAAGELLIVRTPSPVLYDEANDTSKTLAVEDGAVEAVDPSWDSST